MPYALSPRLLHGLLTGTDAGAKGDDRGLE